MVCMMIGAQAIYQRGLELSCTDTLSGPERSFSLKKANQ